MREALTRDSVETAKQNGNKITRSTAEREAKAFIQNIHHFRDDNLESVIAPIEKVVVFDEAQRAWQKEQVSKFMKTKKGIENFEMSEPEYLTQITQLKFFEISLWGNPKFRRTIFCVFW